jgi:hypothetical protein
MLNILENPVNPVYVPYRFAYVLMSVESAINSDLLWYKDAVFYEIYVRGFYDSNADGIGDFRGLTEKLDYLKWLGVDCLWLLPIYASPLRDGGYDISDYYSVLPEYGTLDDFKIFLDAAHAPPLLQPSARPQLRQPRSPAGRLRRHFILAGDGSRRLQARRGPLSL